MTKSDQRKIFLFMVTTVEGYFEGKNHDISWHNVDNEFDKFAVDQLEETDTLIFGHKTYDLMAGFWPTKEAKELDPITANAMNSMNKIVFSHKKFVPKWTPTAVHTNVKILSKMKKAKGKDMIVIGSSNLCVSLIENKLIDEIRILVTPVLIGKGTPLFKGLNKKYNLSLVGNRNFINGNFLLTYEVEH